LKKNSRGYVLQDLARSIIKDCFWEYDFSKKDIYSMANGNDMKAKVFLFSKILANATDMIKSMKIFSKDDLDKLVESYEAPSFNNDFLKRRLNMLEFYFLGKELTVTELKWVA
jgi:hypothetical protein